MYEVDKVIEKSLIEALHYRRKTTKKVRINTAGEVTCPAPLTLINTGQSSDTTKKPQVKFHFTLTNLRRSLHDDTSYECDDRMIVFVAVYSHPYSPKMKYFITII